MLYLISCFKHMTYSKWVLRNTRSTFLVDCLKLRPENIRHGQPFSPLWTMFNLTHLSSSSHSLSLSLSQFFWLLFSVFRVSLSPFLYLASLTPFLYLRFLAMVYLSPILCLPFLCLPFLCPRFSVSVSLTPFLCLPFTVSPSLSLFL